MMAGLNLRDKESNMSNENTENFKTHYANIKKIANEIKNQEEPDIDALVPQVDAALKSYAFCKDRLASVKALLNEKLPTGLD